MTSAAFVFATLVSMQASSPRSDTDTPGAVVLLANKDRSDPQAADAVRRALTSADPFVRRAAARVASVSQPAAYDALLRALPDEQDPAVAVEFIADALALGGESALQRVEPVARGLKADGILPIAEWLARTKPEEFLRRLPEWGRVPEAANRLTNVLVLAASRHPESRERILAEWKPIVSEKSWTRAADAISKNQVVTMRTPPGLAAQVMASTLTAAGCIAKKGMVGNAFVTYTAGGRPTRIEVNVAHLPQPCQNALTAIARVGLDEFDSGGQPQTVIIPLTPEFTSCAADAGSRDEPHQPGTASGLKDPILKKEVKPNYTEGAMHRKVEGREDLDAIVSQTGCISFAKVTRALDPELDAQGIIAVTQWRFQPGVLDGRQVRLLISVELTFTLRR